MNFSKASEPIGLEMNREIKYMFDSLQIHNIVEYGFSGPMMRTHKNNKIKM